MRPESVWQRHRHAFLGVTYLAALALFASRHPDRVDALVVTNPGPPFDPEGVEALESEMVSLADEQLRYEATAKLAVKLVDDGCDGLVVTGTTGETSTLTDEENLGMFRCVVEAVGGQGLQQLAGARPHDADVVRVLPAANPNSAFRAALQRLRAASRRREQPLERHGHAHAGTFSGRVGEVPVYNVSVPVMGEDWWEFELSGDLGHMAALVAGTVELVAARHTRSVQRGGRVAFAQAAHDDELAVLHRNPAHALYRLRRITDATNGEDPLAAIKGRLAGYSPGVTLISFGFEQRAGGHLFQLNFSNGFGTTLAQVARGGTARDDWYLGFNLARKFF